MTPLLVIARHDSAEAISWRGRGDCHTRQVGAQDEGKDSFGPQVRVNFPLPLTLSRQGRENYKKRFFASLRMTMGEGLAMTPLLVIARHDSAKAISWRGRGDCHPPRARNDKRQGFRTTKDLVEINSSTVSQMKTESPFCGTI